MGIVQHELFEGKKPGPKPNVHPKGKRICSECHIAKPYGAFHRNKQVLGGLAYYCKACMAKRAESYRAQVKAASWLRKYGITEHTYWELFERQGGVCAICGQPETKVHQGIIAHLSVDHNHKTGQVRGLLCDACNRGIGNFRDDTSLMERAIEYLRIASTSENVSSHK